MSWDWEKLKQQQSGRGGMPPQVDDIVQGLKKFKLPGGPLVIGVLLALLVASTAFYTINQDEVGVVQRFGRYIETTQPGLNFKLPLGIDSVTKVNVKSVRTEEFGGGPAETDFRARTRPGGDPGNVSLMLTGDLNVALVPWIVQYRIKDPYNFLFKVNDVRRLLNDMSEAVMRLVVGDRSINEVISKRGEIANEARDLLQRELDLAEAGIHIVTVELKRTNVPLPVQPSFNEVNQATQEREQTIYQANEEYNKAIPAARGSADRTIREAEGYALNRVNRAEGDAARFRQVYEEYRKAKDVTARRLYLEKMRTVLENMGPVYIVDPDQKSALPLLNLMNPAVKEK
ncbi:MAG: FtsH protease activity modulator HflK [Desulfobacterales bacterium]|jgi:membrane protease subunit HflK|nr:FtsH protease activity modulator HflK [Desulfobacterales bacterium]